MIFGLPRTKTTALQIQLGGIFAIKSYSEAYNPHIGKCINQDPYEWTRNIEHGVVKLLTGNLIERPELNFTELWNVGWDRLVITRRQNLADAACSLYYADHVAGQYHYESHQAVPQHQFDMDLKWLGRRWYNEMHMWYQSQREIRDLCIDYDIVDYDSYVPGVFQTVAGRRFAQGGIENSYVDTKLNYTELCRNYTRVVEIVKTLEDILC